MIQITSFAMNTDSMAINSLIRAAGATCFKVAYTTRKLIGGGTETTKHYYTMITKVDFSTLGGRTQTITA